MNPAIQSITCPCKCDLPFFCPVLEQRMTPYLAELCQTRPEYRAKWERDRLSRGAYPAHGGTADRDERAKSLPSAPSPPAWLTCQFRGQEAGTLPGGLTGVGCATWETPYYHCRAYRQPVLMRAAARCLPRIAEALPGFDGRVCERCDLFTPPFPPITRRNLLFHCYPRKQDDQWLRHFHRLQPHRNAFNGRTVMAVALDDDTHDPARVRDEAAAFGWDDILTVRNDRRLRETVSFRALLETVASPDPREATMYAHTKGFTNQAENAGKERGIRLWIETMYRTLLDEWPGAIEALRTHAAAGCCKIVWPAGERPPYPTALAVGRWMFAGTFFWFRHASVFSRPGWDRIADDRYAVEAWLSSVLEPDEGRSLYQPWPEDVYPTPSPYEESVYAPL